jgi:hypothetical protein
MSNNGAPLDQQVKAYLNQQTAELLVLRITLQVLIWNIVRNEQAATGILDLLRQQVMASLNTTLAIPPALQGRPDLEQMRKMTLARAEKIFQDIAKTLAGPTPPAGGAPPSTGL